MLFGLGGAAMLAGLGSLAFRRRLTRGGQRRAAGTGDRAPGG
ncbi:MAG TPA: hypothetical protein VKV38_17615 [Trebonia sp.]|nr:hypothetical protein [Trebonia sp.]